MDNITSILHIWSSGIRSNESQECVIAEDRVDLFQERGPGRVLKRNLGASPDRVVENAVVRAPRVVIVATEDRSQDPDHTVRNRDRIVQDRSLETALDRVAAGNRQVDPSREGEQDRILRRSARTNRLADRSQAPKLVALDPDEDRDPEVVLNLATGIVTGTDAARDHLLSSESHGRDHDPHHPDGDHTAVLGLCQSRQVVEVAPGQELLPQIMLTSKM